MIRHPFKNVTNVKILETFVLRNSYEIMFLEWESVKVNICVTEKYLRLEKNV